MSRIYSSHTFIITYRLLTIVALLFVSRLLFLFLNYTLFGPVDFSALICIMWGGLRFDLSALIYLNFVYIIAQFLPFQFVQNKKYQKVLFYLFVITNGIGLLANSIDIAYYRFTLKRTTADVFSVIGNGYDLFTLLPRFIIDFWFVPLIWSLLFSALIVLYNVPAKTKTITSSERPLKPLSIKLTRSLTIVLALIIGFVLLRGGIQMRPINLTTAGTYALPKHIPVVLNTPFTVFRTLQYNKLEPVNYLPKQELVNYFNPTFLPDTGTFNAKNVVVLILESFSKEYIGALNKDLDNASYQGYTPFLDSLIGHSYVMTNCFANGRKSIEAIPAILCGLPSWMTNPFTTSVYSSNAIVSPATLLKPYNYLSLFFHGGTNGTMGFNDFVATAGFDQYYGRKEYNNDKEYDGNWGIYDEPFLQFMSATLTATKEPFIAYAFTLSSHHPYQIPTQYAKQFKPTNPEILRTVRYTDYALKQFFNTAKKQEWFKNTIFVITADHTYQSLHPFYQTRLGSYSVPLIIYDPSTTIRHALNDKICQQIDILPTVTDIINYPKSYKCYGSSILQYKNKGYSLSYINESWQFIFEKQVFEFNGDRFTSIYQYESDSLLQKNLVEVPSKQTKMADRMLRSIIQTYTTDMISNKLSK